MTTTAPDLLSLEPDPLEPTPAEVERYIDALQGHDDPGLARSRAWNQIRLAGVRARARRAEALRSLDLIFRRGTPPDPPLDGDTRGAIITPVLPAPAQAVARAAGEAWMPWLGKTFHAGEQTGVNVVTGDARLPFKALWPSYEPEQLGDGRLAVMTFDTRVGPGTLDPDRQVLKIDYDHDGNPKLAIRNILDELVQVVPGAYLGKMLMRTKRGAPFRLTAYFALEQPG